MKKVEMFCWSQLKIWHSANVGLEKYNIANLIVVHQIVSFCRIQQKLVASEETQFLFSFLLPKPFRQMNSHLISATKCWVSVFFFPSHLIWLFAQCLDLLNKKKKIKSVQEPLKLSKYLSQTGFDKSWKIKAVHAFFLYQHVTWQVWISLSKLTAHVAHVHLCNC